MTVRYTPGQLRDAVGISQETYRHWKKALPPLRGGAGHGPRFSVGDLLAVVVVKILTNDFAIRVSAISVIASALFETCNAVPWPALERGKLFVDLAAGGLQFIHGTESTALRTPMLVIPLLSSMLLLRAALLTEHDQSTQTSLPFPPTSTTVTPPTSPGAVDDALEAQT